MRPSGETAVPLDGPADLHDLGAFLRQLPEEEPLLFVGLGCEVNQVGALLVELTDATRRETKNLAYAFYRSPQIEWAE